MKVLIDTNVLVSAILRDKDPQTVIQWIINQDDWEWIVSPEINSEYKDVLARAKFGIPTDLLQQWYGLIDYFTEAKDVGLPVDFPRDPNDEKFLSCALAIDAEYFITGDNRSG